MLNQYLTDPRDVALFGGTPLLMQPRFGELPELAIGGRRYISGSNGIFVEARTALLHVCVRIGDCALPYGEVDAFVRFSEGLPDSVLLEQCIADAKAHCPNEWAGLIKFDAGEYRYEQPAAHARGPGSVSYCNDHDENELLIDLHSHGTGASYFSGQDDLDDIANGAAVFIAGVIGRCDQAQPTACWRLVIGNIFVPMDWAPFAGCGTEGRG